MNNRITPTFRMSESEKHSQLWLRIKEHLENLNDRDRRLNDDPALTEEETRVLRCKIAARKELISLDF